jgi:4-hydroxybenzoate polyprenyltransferase
VAAAVAFAFALQVPLSYAGFVLRAIAIPMLLVQCSIALLNDWADREADARSHRARPLPQGLVAPSVALTGAVVCALAAASWSLLVGDGAGATLLLVIGIAAGWSYDLWLKPTPLSALPFAIAFPLLLVWVALIVGFGPPPWLAFAAGVPLAVAIHLGDALPDLAEDARSDMRTLAVTLGRRRTTQAAAGALLVGVGVMTAATLPVRPLVALLIALIGLGAATVYATMAPSRWVIAGAAGSAAFAWLSSAGW